MKVTRRDFLKAGGSAAAMLAAAPQAFAAPLQRKANILFIFIDDMGWQDTGFMGHPHYQTPNIDRIANEGVTFTNAYSSAANCTPSRACVISGWYTPRHGIYNVGDGWGMPKQPTPMFIPILNPENNRIPLENMVVLPQPLNDAGYATGFVGKWHHEPLKREFNFTRAYNEGVIENDYKKVKNFTDKAIEFITEHKDQPWFFYLSHRSVHTPWEAPPELISKWRSRNVEDPEYAATLEYLDIHTGRLLDTLNTLGIADNTAVFFVSDNGGEGGNGPLRSHKQTLYEGGIRVPFAVRWPGNVAAGTTSDVPISGVDLYPTFCEIAGAPLPSGHQLDGESVVPLMTGTGTPKREAIYWHVANYWGMSVPATAMRMGDYKLIEYFETASLELYNLKEDIGETTNLADSMAQKAAEMHARMRQWRQDIQAPVPTRINPEYTGDITGIRPYRTPTGSEPRARGSIITGISPKPHSAAGTYTITGRKIGRGSGMAGRATQNLIRTQK